jgi:uncharacterized protein
MSPFRLANGYPQTGELQVGQAAAHRAPQATRMLAWAGVDGLRLEAAREVLGERCLRASGSLVNTRYEDTEAYFASYSLATDDAGVAQRLAVRTTRAHGEQYLTLTRSEEDLWLVDYQLDQGARTLRTHFGGALDVDLAFSPLFHALPIRRLGLHRDAAQHDLAAVFISLPALEVDCVQQTYRTISVGEPTVVSVTNEVFTTDFTLDTDGLVIDYAGWPIGPEVGVSRRRFRRRCCTARGADRFAIRVVGTVPFSGCRWWTAHSAFPVSAGGEIYGAKLSSSGRWMMRWTVERPTLYSSARSARDTSPSA